MHQLPRWDFFREGEPSGELFSNLNREGKPPGEPFSNLNREGEPVSAAARTEPRPPGITKLRSEQSVISSKPLQAIGRPGGA